MARLDDLEIFKPVNRKAWRSWLAKNHLTKDRVWVLLKKKSAKSAGISYEDAVQEALCVGWIDSVTRKSDDEFYAQLYSRRKPIGVWSASNKKRVEELIRKKQMKTAGLVSIELAKANGSWGRIDQSEAWEMPEDLVAAFKKNKKAAANFEAFTPFAKKWTYQWILLAKREETRQKRVALAVSEAAENRRLV
ncbi:YdeI/OmpD-associated family protein [Pollutibacter soli]|uniref:YdeI/OmpD-associated family protein n=1 Tax=Pollutibacter soli TaxID=3034157 RepID=UPI003013A923